MDSKLTKFLKKTTEYCFYLFVFLLPWQTKIILRSGHTNFQEISLYLSHLLLLLIIIVFFVYKLRRRVGDEPISWLWVTLAALELSVLISFFIAPDQVLAFYHYILLLAGVGLFYLLREGTAAAGYEDAALDKIKIVYSFAVSIFLQAILGVYQFLSQSTLVFKYLGLAAHGASTPGAAVIETVSGRWLRAYGGMDHPNIFGGVLAIALIIVAYLLAKKKIIRSGREIGESVLLFIFYFISLFALFFTFSRTAWLAYGLGLLSLLIVLIIRKDYWILGRFIALIFFSAVMIFIVAFPYRDLLRVRVEGGTRLEQKSVDERVEYLTQAEGLVRANWLLGTGIGNYTLALERQDTIKKTPWDYQPVHNVFLLLWAESGVLSLIFFLGFLVLLFIKNRHEGFSVAILVAVIILMLFDHWLLSLPFGVIFLFLALGLI